MKHAAMIVAGAALLAPLTGCKVEAEQPVIPATERECIQYETRIQHERYVHGIIREAIRRGCRFTAKEVP